MLFQQKAFEQLQEFVEESLSPQALSLMSSEDSKQKEHVNKLLAKYVFLFYNFFCNV